MCPKAKCGEAPTHLVALEETNSNSGLDSPNFHPRTEANTIFGRYFIFGILKMYRKFINSVLLNVIFHRHNSLELNLMLQFYLFFDLLSRW
jgi:hypothetical protein